MKKLIIVCVVMFMGIVTIGQNAPKIYEVLHKSTSFGRKISVGDYIFLTDSAAVYRITTAQTALSTMGVVFVRGQYTRFTSQASTVAIAAAPGTSTSTGVKGQFYTDGSYLYVCTATNTWKKVAISW